MKGNHFQYSNFLHQISKWTTQDKSPLKVSFEYFSKGGKQGAKIDE